VYGLGVTPYGNDSVASSRRRLALTVVCAIQLMVFLDASSINVALPAIQHSLRLNAAGLAWVVDAYLIGFGGLLLLAGRAGDLLGRRRMLIGGVAAFALASAGCAAAPSAAALIAWRAAQGLSAAVVSPLVLAQVVTLHPAPERRARALGILSFVSAGGGSLGVLAGGALTTAAGWRAIFLTTFPSESGPHFCWGNCCRWTPAARCRVAWMCRERC